MTTMLIDNHPLTQRRLQFIGIGFNKLTLKSIAIIQSSKTTTSKMEICICVLCIYRFLSENISCLYMHSRWVLLVKQNAFTIDAATSIISRNEIFTIDTLYLNFS